MTASINRKTGTSIKWFVAVLSALSIALAGVVALLASRSWRDNPFAHAVLARRAPILKDADANDAERELKRNPHDLTKREELIRYYTMRFASSPDHSEFEDMREKHVLWLIGHHPECECAATPEAWISPDDPHYPEAKALWMRQAEISSNDPSILSNAATALFFEPKISRELANRALSLNPGDAHVLQVLAESYTQEMRAADSLDRKKAVAGQALTAWESYLRAESNVAEQREHLRDVAISALESGDRAKASRFATALLNPEATTEKPDADDIHIANTVLGQIALNDGNVAEAKSRLMASAPEHGSPSLDSYGPRMSLASALLDRGEREIVIAYLDRCSRFWQRGAEKIGVWEAEIRSSKRPDFGKNVLL